MTTAIRDHVAALALAQLDAALAYYTAPGAEAADALRALTTARGLFGTTVNAVAQAVALGRDPADHLTAGADEDERRLDADPPAVAADGDTRRRLIAEKRIAARMLRGATAIDAGRVVAFVDGEMTKVYAPDPAEDPADERADATAHGAAAEWDAAGGEA